MLFYDRNLRILSLSLEQVDLWLELRVPEKRAVLIRVAILPMVHVVRRFSPYKPRVRL